jgi:hypothetical protein
LIAALVSRIWSVQPTVAAAQTEPRVDDTVQMLEQNVEDFLERIEFDVRAALDDLLEGSPLSSQTDAVTTLENKTRGISGQYGQIQGFERASSRRLGSRVVLVRYLLNCENYPLVWYVTYYQAPKRGEQSRNGENWVVVSLRFDTNVELLALEK